MKHQRQPMEGPSDCATGFVICHHTGNQRRAYAGLLTGFCPHCLFGSPTLQGIIRNKNSQNSLSLIPIGHWHMFEERFLTVKVHSIMKGIKTSKKLQMGSSSSSSKSEVSSGIWRKPDRFCLDHQVLSLEGSQHYLSR